MAKASWLIAAVVALGLSGCASGPPAPTPEQKAQFDAETAAALEARNAGKITWKEWATRANTALVAYLGPQSLDMQAYLAKRVYLGSEVDARRMTPEAAQAVMAQDAATMQRQREQDVLARRAVRAAEAASDPVVCNRYGNVVSCY